MSNEREAMARIQAYLNERVPVRGIDQELIHCMNDKELRVSDIVALLAARQSAGANETALRVLSSHAIRKHEGVTIFGDPAQVLKVMAAIESAGATGQEAVAWMHKQGDFLEPSLRQLDSGELSRGWTQEPLFYAAPIGDNGAFVVPERRRGETFAEWAKRAYEQNASQPAESKRVELTDEEIGHLRLIVSFCETLSSIERGSYADDALRALRLFLARASAKGA